jgi:hypothetical protein
MKSYNHHSEEEDRELQKSDNVEISEEDHHLTSLPGPITEL